MFSSIPSQCFGQLRFSCDVCYTEMYWDSLQEHIAGHYGLPSDFKCGCGSVFFSNLLAHIHSSQCKHKMNISYSTIDIRQLNNYTEHLFRLMTTVFCEKMQKTNELCRRTYSFLHKLRDRCVDKERSVYSSSLKSELSNLSRFSTSASNVKYDHVENDVATIATPIRVKSKHKKHQGYVEKTKEEDTTVDPKRSEMNVECNGNEDDDIVFLFSTSRPSDSKEVVTVDDNENEFVDEKKSEGLILDSSTVAKEMEDRSRKSESTVCQRELDGVDNEKNMDIAPHSLLMAEIEENGESGKRKRKSPRNCRETLLYQIGEKHMKLDIGEEKEREEGVEKETEDDRDGVIRQIEEVDERHRDDMEKETEKDSDGVRHIEEVDERHGEKMKIEGGKEETAVEEKNHREIVQQGSADVVVSDVPWPNQMPTYDYYHPVHPYPLPYLPYYQPLPLPRPLRNPPLPSLPPSVHCDNTFKSTFLVPNQSMNMGIALPLAPPLPVHHESGTSSQHHDSSYPFGDGNRGPSRYPLNVKKCPFHMIFDPSHFAPHCVRAISVEERTSMFLRNGGCPQLKCINLHRGDCIRKANQVCSLCSGPHHPIFCSA